MSTPAVRHRRYYPTLSSFAAKAAEGGHVYGINQADSWSGNVTLEGAIALATKGWREGAKRAAEQSRRIANRTVTATASASNYAIQYDVAGAAYDAGAYTMGVPEAWARPEPQPTRKGIRIVYNAIASGGVDADVLQTRGMAVAALALALNAKGYPLTIDVIFPANWYGHGDDCTVVRVADAHSGSILDVDRIVYALGHPSMLRRLHQGEFTACTGKGWGPGQPRDNVTDGACDLYIGGVHLKSAERWRDGGEAWVLEEFKRQTTGAR